MLFHKKLNKGQSIVNRVTAWYAILITGLLITITILIFSISGYISHRSLERELIEDVTELAFDIDDFESYDDGIYYLLYNADGTVIRGEIPKDFDASLSFNNEELQHITVQTTRYSYYDIQVANSQQWLRAITITSKMSNDMRIFLISLLIGLPIFLIAVITGGYLILKRAFYPVQDMIGTAKQITNEKDYSQRLATQVNDIELKELEEAFNLMLTSIEDSFNREKQFNHDVSHELRTPLAVILAESDFGQHYVTDIKEAKEGYQTIHRQGKKMQSMINQILELSRTENLQSIETESIDLSQLVANQSKDYEILASQKGLELLVENPEGQVIKGNQLLLIRLLDNLVTNAIKYANQTVGIKISPSPKGTELIIWDDGIGIAKENHDKIWNRFFQINATRQQREDSNSGLGLSLVKRIVELHGATIALESDLDQGAKFIILFPQK